MVKGSRNITNAGIECADWEAIVKKQPKSGVKAGLPLGFHLRRLIVVLLVAFAFFILYGCKGNVITDVRGTIVTTWSRNVVKAIRLPKHAVDSVLVPSGWEYPWVAVAISDSQAIIGCSQDYDMTSIRDQKDRPSDHLAILSVGSMVLNPITVLDRHKYFVDGLDFDPGSREFVFCGIFDTLRGPLVFDSAWNLIDVIRDSQIDSDYITSAWSVIGGRIAYFADEGTVLFDRKSRKTELVSDSRCVGTTLDRRQLVMLDAHRKGHFLLNLDDRHRTEFPVPADEVSTFAFSPGGRFVAYLTIGGFDVCRLNILDTKTNQFGPTKIIDVGELVWLRD
jgi:hypothetical protein